MPHLLDLTESQRYFIQRNCMVDNFPKSGVRFLDIFPFMEKYFQPLVFPMQFDDSIVLLPEARGFLFYSAIGPEKIIPIRKEGKLPGMIYSFESTKEYGTDVLTFQETALWRQIKRYVSTHPHATVIPLVFFDDIAATGQTAESVIKFFQNFKYLDYTFRIAGCKFYFELQGLGARERIETLGVDFTTVFTY